MKEQVWERMSEFYSEMDYGEKWVKHKSVNKEQGSSYERKTYAYIHMGMITS